MPEERQILDLKYKSKTLAAMTPKELNLAANEVLLKIHVITGWQLPANELLAILLDEFKLKMIESYPQVNVDEITHAFRNKPTEIKEWGKALSISIIDEVMVPYLEKRFSISRIEEQKKQIEHKPSQAEIDQIEKEYHEFLKTDLGKRMTEKPVTPGSE